MALGTLPASIGGVAKTLIVALDQSSNLAAAHVTVNGSGVEVGTTANPLGVTVTNQSTLHADGGGLAHVTNFPTTQAVTLAALPALPTGGNTIGAVTQASGPWAVSWSGQSVAATQGGAWTVTLGAGSATIGSVSVTGSVAVTGSFFPATQPISAASLPLPANAAQDGTDAAGIAAPAGGAGIRGWLSGIYAKVSGTLAVGVTTALPAGSNTIGAVTGSGAFTVSGQGVAGAAPVNPPVSIAGVDAGGLKQHFRTDTFGTPADPAWSSGSGSLVALGKALVAAQQATTAAVTGSSLVPPSPSFVQTSTLAASLVLKSAAGSLYACYVTTGSNPGWLMLFDAAALPANGPVTPKDCIYCPANATTEVELPFLTAEPFSTGITAAFSSTGPFNLTASSTAFIKGIVQ